MRAYPAHPRVRLQAGGRVPGGGGATLWRKSRAQGKGAVGPLLECGRRCGDGPRAPAMQQVPVRCVLGALAGGAKGRAVFSFDGFRTRQLICRNRI
ncbi:MAG: hypothetical protein PHS80_02465 [Methanothrix sp.]|nr:hypothetical protein [Methanothrix sp.]MDD4447750.1 hypothetical protein [Methanothrix sp.]